MTHILKHSDAVDFMLAGNATVTVLNTATGNRFTYKVKRHKDELYFVRVLTGPETYTFIGSIFKKKYKHSAKSKIKNEAQSVIVFNYVLDKLLEGTLNPCVEIWHEGKCGRCGRELTVTSSIENGIGPECAKRMLSKADIRQIKIDKILS